MNCNRYTLNIFIFNPFRIALRCQMETILFSGRCLKLYKWNKLVQNYRCRPWSIPWRATSWPPSPHWSSSGGTCTRFAPTRHWASPPTSTDRRSLSRWVPGPLREYIGTLDVSVLVGFVWDFRQHASGRLHARAHNEAVLNSVADPDPHGSASNWKVGSGSASKLYAEPGSTSICRWQAKMYEPIWALFQGFEPLLEDKIRIRIKVKGRIRIRIRIKVTSRIRIRTTCFEEHIRLVWKEHQAPPTNPMNIRSQVRLGPFWPFGGQGPSS